MKKNLRYIIHRQCNKTGLHYVVKSLAAAYDIKETPKKFGPFKWNKKETLLDEEYNRRELIKQILDSEKYFKDDSIYVIEEYNSTTSTSNKDYWPHSNLIWKNGWI